MPASANSMSAAIYLGFAMSLLGMAACQTSQEGDDNGMSTDIKSWAINVSVDAYTAADGVRYNAEEFVGGGEVHLSALPKGNNVEIGVSDTGGGMNEETLRRAAEPFFTTRAYGSGRGIYLAQTLTEKMGGRMFIRTRLGEGTSVSIVLPAADLTARGN